LYPCCRPEIVSSSIHLVSALFFAVLLDGDLHVIRHMAADAASSKNLYNRLLIFDNY
jgi:hypothetical protein